MPVYGPYEQKTLVQDWQQAFYGFLKTYTAQEEVFFTNPSYFGILDEDRPKYDNAEQALFYDEYPAGCGGLVSMVKMLNNYPITLESSVKSTGSVPFTAANGDVVVNPNYWNGIVLWTSVANYHCLVQVENVAGQGTPPKIVMALGESGIPTATLVNNASEDVYHILRLEYDGNGNVTAKVDNINKGSWNVPLQGITPAAIITANDVHHTHTGAWFKTLTATGVIVVGFGADGQQWDKVTFNRNNVTISPCLGVGADRTGLELTNSWGKRTFSTDPLGTYSLSGNIETVPLLPPNLAGWDKLHWDADFKSGDIQIQILDEFGGVIPEIPGNSSKITLKGKTDIDLEALDISKYPRIRFKLYFSTTTNATSPILYELYATFSTTTNTLSYTKLPTIIRDFPNQINYSGSPVNVDFQLIEHTDYEVRTDLKIYDTNNQLIRTITVPKMRIEHHMGYDTTQTITWDGKDDNGNLVSTGTYLTKLEVTDSLGNVTLSEENSVVNVDTKRTLIASDIVNVDTKRILTISDTVNVDTKRILMESTEINVDVLRRLYQTVSDTVLLSEYLQALKAILSLLQGGV